MMMKRSALALALLSLLALPILGQSGQTSAQTSPKPTMDPLTQDAIKKVEAGDTAGAIRELEAQRAAKTASPQGLALLGTLYLQQGKAQEALAVLKPLADARNADPAVLYNAARAAFALKQVEAGAGYLQRGAQAAPASPAARDLGILVMRQGQLVEAYALLRPWVRLTRRTPRRASPRPRSPCSSSVRRRPRDASPRPACPKDDPAIQLLRGRVLHPEGRRRRGGRPARASRQEPPAGDGSGDPPRPGRGLSAGEPAGRRREAARRARRAAPRPGAPPRPRPAQGGERRRRPGHPEAVRRQAAGQCGVGGRSAARLGIALETGALLTEAGRAAEAVPVLEKATKLYPQSPPAWEALAKALDAAGRKDEAAKARARVDEIFRAASGAAGGATLSAGMIEAGDRLAGGQPEKALTAARREIAASPGDRQARALEMRLLLMLQRKQEALRIRRSPPPDAGHPELLYQRGAVHMASAT